MCTCTCNSCLKYHSALIIVPPTSPLPPPLPSPPPSLTAEVAQWKADKILSPAKRGRKPGSGKKNIVRAATGKEVFIFLDMARYPSGSILLQVHALASYPSLSERKGLGTRLVHARV